MQDKYEKVKDQLVLFQNPGRMHDAREGVTVLKDYLQVVSALGNGFAKEHGRDLQIIADEISNGLGKPSDGNAITGSI